MLNNSDTRTIISEGLETTNGLGIDWIANNIYWTDNDIKVSMKINYISLFDKLFCIFYTLIVLIN